MITVLFVTNSKKLARYAAYFVGALNAIFILFETPLSGAEYEPRTNTRFSISRRLLARDLDLFHSTDVGDALRGGGISTSSRRRHSVLRKTPSRKQQTLHLPARATRLVILDISLRTKERCETRCQIFMIVSTNSKRLSSPEFLSGTLGRESGGAVARPSEMAHSE